MVNPILVLMNIFMTPRRLKNKLLILIVIPGVFFSSLKAQDKPFKVMFYNTENLFDTQDDSTKNDNDFLPQSKKHWTREKFDTKISNLYKTIVAVGKESQPDIIGLCEVENIRCLKALALYSPLSAFEYRIVHYESPDPRGIDVALLYNPQTFKCVNSKPLSVIVGEKKKQRSRDILLVKGVILPKDTVFVFVNHWSSRRMGEEQSESKRLQAAAVLKSSIDSVKRTSKTASIIAIGDFNDTPSNTSISKVLGAADCSKTGAELCNLSWQYEFPGTYKYKGNWDTFDQIIVSVSLQKKFPKYSAKICNEPFLLIDDVKYSGQEPYRTFRGMRYEGGFSDHLPVLLELER